MQGDHVFKKLYNVDVSDFIESEGEDSMPYLPWATAYRLLLTHYPDAKTEIVRFPDENGKNDLPYLKTSIGYFVEVAVTVNEIRRSCLMPVLDEDYKPIKDPDAFDINFSLQRALTKAIAYHGLGLSLWEKEKGDTGDTGFPQEARKQNEVQSGRGLQRTATRKSSSVRKGVITFLDIAAHQTDLGVYYALKVQEGDETFDLLIVGDVMMNRFDNLDPRPGDKFNYCAELRKDRFVVSNISRAG